MYKNETDKIQWDFEIQKDNQNTDQILINKKEKELGIKWILLFQRILWVKIKESEILGPCQRAEKQTNCATRRWRWHLQLLVYMKRFLKAWRKKIEGIGDQRKTIRTTTLLRSHTHTHTKRIFQINTHTYICHHHHHVTLVARISLTLSRHSSLSFIALGRSSGQHPVSSHSCWMYVRAGRPAFARPCVGVHKSTSLMSSSLLLQLCPACLVRLTWIVFVIGGRWPYSCCLVGCCRHDLFKIACSILV